MHDKYEQFFRYKIKCLNNFEESRAFDRSKILRIRSRRLIRRYDLEKVFDNL